MALTKRAEPAELRTIFLKVGIMESYFLLHLCSVAFRDYFQTALYSIVMFDFFLKSQNAYLFNTLKSFPVFL